MARVEVAFAGADRGVENGEEQAYERALPLEEATRDEVFVAYEMNGQPLLPQHGAPARLVVPGFYGMAHVKWLGRVSALPRPFEGYQNVVAYRMRTNPDEIGTPLSRIRVKSLMVPPGVPTFPERERIVRAGHVALEGRAWSGSAAIERVQVSLDACSTWHDATVSAAAAPHAWQRWTFDWTATPGVHDLACRATDATGATQPLEPEPNLGGYANNAVHRVRVTVRG